LRTKKTHNCALPLLCLTERILMQFFSHMFLLPFSWQQETHNFCPANVIGRDPVQLYWRDYMEYALHEL